MNDKRFHRLIIGTVSFGSFIGALDMSIVNISLPAIISDFNVPIGLGSMVVLSYLLTLTCLILFMGNLADRFGFRRIFLAGLLVFGIGSILCGFASCIYALIASRMIQAAGAAMLSATGAAIITRYLPGHVRGRAMGYLITFSAIGYALAPGLGGLLSGYISWRLIFLINIPVVIIGFFLGRHSIPEDGGGHGFKCLDLPGLTLFIVSLAGILTGFSLYQVPGTPDSVLLLLFTIGICAGITWYLRERRSICPLVNRELGSNRDFILGLAASFIVMALFSGVTYLMPLYLVNSRHLEVFVAGMIMTIPALLSMVIAPISGGLSDAYGTRIVSIIAIGLAAVGYLTILTFNPATAIILIVAGVLIARVATAAFCGPNGKMIMSHCPPTAIGNGAGIMMPVRHAGLVFGIPLFQSVFAIRMYLEGVVRDGTPLVPRITPAQAVLGYQAVYLVALCLSIVVIVLIYLDKETSQEYEEPSYEEQAI
jgi:EmrB/QacA subfamily drug resistance transporter